MEPGAFAVDGGITLPAGSKLIGAVSAGSTTLILSANPAGDNFLIAMSSRSEIGFVNLNVNGLLPGGCCSAGIVIGSIANALVHDLAVQGQHRPVATGVYFIGSSASSNLVLRVTITGMHYGTIFVAGLQRNSGNRIESSTLHENHCDAVTFAGYGELTKSYIHSNGFDCNNGNPPIPGGGPYCLGNRNGALISQNTVKNNCGMLLDIDSCSGFNVTGNVFAQPGNTWGGKYPYCQGSLAANLVDSSDFVFQNNEVHNTLSSNAVGLSHWGDSNHIFSDTNAAPFSDLPNAGNTVVAFSITTRPSSISTTNNVISGNSFQADCGASGCAGVGYFAGRGTGWLGSSGPWKPNLYTSNNPFGSNIGSKRCGGNWYAGNTPSCPATNPPAPCNADDYQHPDTANWRNDAGCGQYS